MQSAAVTPHRYVASSGEVVVDGRIRLGIRVVTSLREIPAELGRDSSVGRKGLKSRCPTRMKGESASCKES